MNTKYVIIAMLLCSTTINAQFVPSEQAKQKGLAFLNSLSIAKTRGSVSSDQLKLCHTEYETDMKTPTLYVFNSDLTSVVVSADERACDILGYTDKGISDPESVACGYKALLEMYSEQISYARKNNLSKYIKTRGTDDDRKEIAPMLTSKWGQSAPYNNKCPIDKNTKKRCVAGCVPVAMAQLMYYFKWPDIGTGTHSYYWEKGNEVLSADFESQPYHMENMKDEYKETDTDDNLSTLLYHCGVAAHAGYSSSSTSGHECGLHFAKYFKYSDNFWDIGKNTSESKVMVDEVYKELARNHPMMVSIWKDSGDGHMVVCDGYRDGKLHYNFGWDGAGDGYYLPNIINVIGATYTGISFDMGFIPKNDEVEVDGFRYEIYQDEAYMVSGKPSGDFRVPSEINYKGKKYCVKSVCHEAFRDSKDLRSVTIPTSLKVLSDSVFAGCSSFKELIIEDGDEPFYWSYWCWYNDFNDSSKVEKVYIGRDLTWVDLRYVKEIIVGPNVSHLGIIAFHNEYRPNKKLVLLGETPPQISERSIEELYGAPVYVPIGALETYKSSEYWKNANLREMPFEYEGLAYTKESDDGVTLVSGEVNSPELVIPEAVSYNNSTFKVVKIGDEAFKDNQTITSVVIGPSIVTIGKNAFYNASELQSVEIKDGDSLLESDKSVFENTKLNKAYIGRSWDGELFTNANELKDVTLSDHVKSIPDYAFRWAGIQNIYIPASVEKLGHSMFNPWVIGDIEISPENNHFVYNDETIYSKDHNRIIQYLGRNSNYIMPNEVTDVGDYAFANNNLLYSIKLSENLESIGVGAFRNAIDTWGSHQDTLYLPKTLKSIANESFYDLEVKAFEVDEECPYFKTINGAIYNKTGNVFVYMPGGAICTVVLAEGVDTIRAGAFELSKATTVFLPSTVKYIGDAAFKYSNIDSLIINCNNPPLCNEYPWSGPFDSWSSRKYNQETGYWDWGDESDRSSYVYVPEGTLSKYQDDYSYWLVRNNLRELSAEEMNKWATTDIKKPINDKRYTDAIYNMNGRKVKKPQKGIYILRSSDGSSKKVIY